MEISSRISTTTTLLRWNVPRWLVAILQILFVVILLISSSTCRCSRFTIIPIQEVASFVFIPNHKNNNNNNKYTTLITPTTNRHKCSTVQYYVQYHQSHPSYDWNGNRRRRSNKYDVGPVKLFNPKRATYQYNNDIIITRLQATTTNDNDDVDFNTNNQAKDNNENDPTGTTNNTTTAKNTTTTTNATSSDNTNNENGQTELVSQFYNYIRQQQNQPTNRDDNTNNDVVIKGSSNNNGPSSSNNNNNNNPVGRTKFTGRNSTTIPTTTTPTTTTTTDSTLLSSLVSSLVSSSNRDIINKDIPTTFILNQRNNRDSTNTNTNDDRNIVFGRDRQSLLFDTSTGSQQRPRNVREELVRREIGIASRFEQTIALQAVFVTLSLCFVLYVGITGGITDGSDRFVDDGNDDDAFDTELYYRYNSNNINVQMDSSISQPSAIGTQIPSIINDKDNNKKLTNGNEGGGTTPTTSIWL